MTVAVQRTVLPTGKVTKHEYGMKVTQVPLSDKEFNRRAKNVLKSVNKLYGVK